jgi:hypothetical protein
MPQLVLGPILRHIGESDATIWVETDVACEVGVLGTSARTFRVDGHHYAIVAVTGLEPGSATEYEVELDGERVWPEPDSPFPPSVIRTLDSTREVRLVFGSCRVSLPHEPPYVLHHAEDERAHGVDALRALGLRMAGSPPEAWPHAIMMLGDQIYADELSPAMSEVAAARTDHRDAPPDELADFAEFALAYREAWSEPAIRWLLSTLPSAMIFDDHEIHSQWKISQAWVDRMRAEPWYESRIADGLAAYWVYQHLGNLSPRELEQNEVLERVRAEEDGATFLREFMRTADRQPGHSRWSFCRDLGHSRLVVIDSRAGRDLEPGEREMIDCTEWDWVAGESAGEFEHLLLASSVPFILPPALHHLETLDEALTAGAWGGAMARVGEAVRQRLVLDHWAAFQRSFRKLAVLLEELASGARGRAPTSIVMLSGDVHHCYLAEVGFRRGTGAQSSVWQAVCSAYRKELATQEMGAMKVGSSRLAAAAARGLAHLAGVEGSGIGWRMVEEPNYDNQVGTLTLRPGSTRVRVETTTGCDWRRPGLRTVFERELVRHPLEAPSADADDSQAAMPAG